MFIGFVLIGMAFGAAAAGFWILTGGSILVAMALCSFVGTLSALGTAVLLVLISKRRESGEESLAWALQTTD